MRNLLVLILLLGAFLLSGFYTVDQRQVAVISSTPTKMEIKAPGLHWKVPLLGNLNYVYMNMRSSYLTTSSVINLADNQKIGTRIIINWQVVSPQVYLSVVLANEKDFDARFAQTVLSQVESVAALSSSPAEFEEQVNAQLVNRELKKLGIKLINVGIIQLVPGIAGESSPVVEIGVANSSESAIESAFYQARQIKSTVESQQTQLLQQLKARNANFFNYWWQIQQLGKTARSKQDIPPLDKIYPTLKAESN